MGLLICAGVNCQQKGNDEITRKIESKILEEGLEGQVTIGQVRCLGMCDIGPNIITVPDGTILSGVTEEKLDDILKPIFERAHKNVKR